MMSRLALFFALVQACLAASVLRRIADHDNDHSQGGHRHPSVINASSGRLVISDEVVSPDGYRRSATVVNGMTPGPLIKAIKGDHFKISVSNELNDPTMAEATSIHWHGIFQRHSSWFDGTASVTQCPVIPDEEFTYNFNANGQAGSYWYHSHYRTQLCDGLRGPLVIYDPDDPHSHLYDVDDESTVITLADWYHSPSPVIAEVTGPVVANSTLINGKGRYLGGPASPLSVIGVEEGKRYRFRIFGMQCDPYYNFTIAGHKMTLIETDGILTEPVEVDSISVFAAQRYSVVVEANQPVDNYWIRARSNFRNQTFAGGLNSAILRYKGASEEEPPIQSKIVDGVVVIETPTEAPLLDSMIHPLINPGAPGIPEIGKADVNINFDISIIGTRYTMNNVSWKSPSTPVLLQILNGKVHPSEIMPHGSVYELPHNKVIELSIPASLSAPGGPHPMHLHGHAFDVVRGPGETEPNFVNPQRRDTVSIGRPGDNVTIRFVTDNSGPWFFHCHIDWHLNHGFAVVMAESPPALASDQQDVPQSWYDLCPKFNEFESAANGTL